MSLTDTRSETKYRILSLDGGGSWAVLQTQALAYVYGKDTPGHDILRHFNLAISNSGGSLVLAGLLCNKTPLQLFRLFANETNRRKIFVEKAQAPLTRRIGVFPRYRASQKAAGFRAAYQHPDVDRKLSEIAADYPHLPPVIFMGFDFHRERAAFFRSRHSDTSSGKKPDDITLLDAINASSNAPINYFDDAVTVNYGGHERQMWDGAIGGFNNPILAGITEAIASGILPQQIQVLSLGTANEFSPMDYDVSEAEINKGNMPRDVIVPEKENPKSFMATLPKMAGSILSEPPDSALFTSFVWLYGKLPQHTPHPLRLVRLNPLVQPIFHPSGDENTPGHWTLPAVFRTHRDYIAFRKLDMDAVPQPDVDSIIRFGAAWLQNDVPNQPIQTGRKLTCKYGHSRAKDALADWQTLTQTSPTQDLLTEADIHPPVR